MFLTVMFDYKYLLLLLLAWICSGVAVAPRGAQDILSTTTCQSIRLERYKARLDIFYFYVIEWYGDSYLDLGGIDNGISAGIVDILSDCDPFGRPKYAVDLSINSHHIAHEGTLIILPNQTTIKVCVTHRFPITDSACVALQEQGTECRVIRGKTAVLLDNNVENIEEVVYFVIDRVLSDQSFISSYSTMHLARAEFVRPIGESLVFRTSEPEDGAENNNPTESLSVVKVGLTSGLISFALTAILIYVVLVYRNTHIEGSSDTRPRCFLPFFQAKRRRFFEKLCDEGACSGVGRSWMTTSADVDVQNRSITWSLSDMTSDSIDSQSIRSCLPMERIVEAQSDEEAASDEEARDSNTIASSIEAHMEFLSQWKCGVEKQGLQQWSHCSDTFEIESSLPRSIFVSRSMPHRLAPATPFDDDYTVSSTTLQGIGCEDDEAAATTPLKGCLYLASDDDTSGEMYFDAEQENVEILYHDDDLLLSDDEYDLMELGHDTRVKSSEQSSAANGTPATIVESVDSDDIFDKTSSPDTPNLVGSILQRLEYAKSVKLLTYTHVY
jgi:hypothetical protein